MMSNVFHSSFALVFMTVDLRYIHNICKTVEIINKLCFSLVCLSRDTAFKQIHEYEFSCKMF